MGESNTLEDLSSLVSSLIGTQALVIPQALPHHGNTVPSLKFITEFTTSPVLNLDTR